MTNLTIKFQDDTFWLHIDGKKQALINLGNGHGPIVTAALQEAAQPPYECGLCFDDPQVDICPQCGRKRD